MDSSAPRCSEKFLIRRRVPEEKRHPRSFCVAVEPVLPSIGRIGFGGFHSEEKLRSNQEAGKSEFQSSIEVARLFGAVRCGLDARQCFGFSQRSAKQAFTIRLNELTGASIIGLGWIRGLARDGLRSLFLAEHLV